MSLLLFLSLPVCLAPGCGSTELRGRTGDVHRWNASDGYAAVYVESRMHAASRATLYIWGRTEVNRPERTFSELLRSSACDSAGLHVVDLNAAADPAFPDGAGRTAELLREAEKQGADLLLVASVRSWHQSYVLFLQWARIRFSLACYSVSDGSRLWTAEASRRRPYSTDRQALLGALDGIFPAAFVRPDAGP